MAELTPNVAEGDFFETAEAFFSGDLAWTLAALHRHFFAGGDARPVISAIQNRNRLLLQVRALLDAGEIRVGPRGIDGLQRAAGGYKDRFAEAAAEKSSYNVFTQNPWYLGKLAGGGKLLPASGGWIDNQRELIAASRGDRPQARRAGGGPEGPRRALPGRLRRIFRSQSQLGPF